MQTDLCDPISSDVVGSKVGLLNPTSSGHYGNEEPRNGIDGNKDTYATQARNDTNG